MTDFENLKSILSMEKILSKNQLSKANKAYVDISDPSVQDGRSKIIIPCTQKPLHDYVPLHWGKKTPMVSRLRDQNETLIFLMFSTNLLGDYHCVISDGHALTKGTIFRKFLAIDDLDILDPRCINTVKYADDAEVKRRKQAELLILDCLPLKYLHCIVTHGVEVRQAAAALLADCEIDCRVRTGRSNFYF